MPGALPQVRRKKLPFERFLWMKYSIPCFLTWAAYLLAFYPGLMTADSIDQWDQFTKFSFNDWHPVFHTLTNWLITRAWYSPAAIALMQVIALSAVVGYFLGLFERQGAPKSLLWVTSALVAIAPANGLMANTLWKDIPYSISVLGLSLLLMKVIVSDGRWLLSRRNVVLLGVIASLVALYRHNGVAVAFGTLALLGLAYRPYWKHIAVTAAVSLAIFYAVVGPVYSILGVEREPNLFWASGAPVHQVAAAIAGGAQIEPDEADFLNQVYPISQWATTYYPYSIDTIIFNKDFNRQAIVDNPDMFKSIWFALVKRNPSAVVAHQLSVSSLVWRVDEPQGSYLYVASTSMPRNQLGLTSASKSPALNGFFRGVISATDKAPLSMFIWRPALYLYLSVLFAIVLAYRRRNYRWLLLFAPVFVHAAVLLLINVAQDFRYMYPAYLTGLLSIGLMYWAVRPGKPASAL